MSNYDNENGESTQDLAQMIDDINRLKARPKQERDKLFKQLLPAINDALQRDVSQKDLLEYLKAKGLKLSPNTFRAKLEAAKLEAQQANPKSSLLKAA